MKNKERKRLMEWQQLFEPHILKRGLGYYKDGLVTDYETGEDFIEATVHGSSNYDVYIHLKEGEPLDMDCDCPHAQSGNHCKHMAAVLFRREKGELPEAQAFLPPVQEEDKEEVQEEDVRALVQSADEAAVRNFLADLLEHSDWLFDRFKETLRGALTAEDIKRYKSHITGIFSEYRDRSGFIDYENASDFADDLYQFIDDEINDMVKKSYYKEAFGLTAFIAEKTGRQAIDDSDGGTSLIASSCDDIWREILGRCGLDLKKKMYKWFKAQLDKSDMDYAEEYIEEVLFDCFQEKAFLKDKRDFCEKRVREYEPEKGEWYSDYRAGKWAVRCIAVMGEMEAPQDEIDRFVKDHMKLNDVRKWYVDDCVKKENYDAAIQALEEGKKIEQDQRFQLIEYSRQLKDLYKQTGRQEAYEKELWLLMLQYDPGDLDTYKELKTLYTEEEWKQKREMIFEKLPRSAGVDKLYKEDQIYDRLLQCVLDSSGLYMLQLYEKCLKKLYPAELLAKYETEVNEMASSTGDRNHYRELVTLLRRMKRYPRGPEKVQEIASSWRQLYKRRPAMMGELDTL